MKKDLQSLKRLFLPAITAAAFLMQAGCGPAKKNTIVDKMEILKGADQCTLPGQAFPQLLRLELLGIQESGILGGKGERQPAAGVKVAFVPIDGSDLKVTPAEAISDDGGSLAVKVIAGAKIGDQYLRVIPENNPEKSKLVRFITGIDISGYNQEGSAGQLLPDPLRIKLVMPDGKPATNIPVYFKLISSPEGNKSKAVLKKQHAVTNQDGEAETNLKLGPKTGEYNIEVEIADPKSNYYVRGIVVKELGLNVISVIITVLGGLALFIFGMKLMSDGLQKVAGDKMKKILHFFASNRFIAVFAGTVVTAVIQSSSATTVMVIGFINAGLLNLTQSIGIIFGANIGTTVTAQIISFKLSGMALPAITLGLLVMFMKNRTVKGWGETILGFGLLFFGMSIMSDELTVLGSFPSFIKFFSTFDCSPFNGYMPLGAVLGAIGIGTLMTMIIQSSSAATGIVLALAAGGLINFYTSVPLIIGTNIGTTITAVLACIPANRYAKQAAFAHCFFNISGAFFMIILFYVTWGSSGIPIFMYFVNSVTPGDAFAAVPQNVVRHIAMAHTFFNVFNVLLLLPFVGILAKICTFFIPVTDKDSIKIQILEPHLLNTPSIALEQVVIAINNMLKDSWKMVDEAVNNHFTKLSINEKAADNLAEREDRIDQQQAEVTEYLVQITRRELSEPQSELVPLLMHCTNDAERIADHTDNIISLTKRLIKTDKKLSESGKKDICKLWELLNNQAENVIKALGGTDLAKVTFALKDEKKINRLAADYEKEHINRLRKGHCDAVVSVIFIEMLGELEKIGDHLSNIAERAPEIQKHYFHLG